MLLGLTLISGGYANNHEGLYSLQGKAESDGLQSDPLAYAAFFARKTNNDYGLGEIAVRYAELGDFEQALMIADTIKDDDDKASSLSKIAVQYWKQGNEGLSRQLFARVSGMPVPKDVIYVWGPILDRMAEARQFDLALDLAESMPESEATTTRAALETLVDHYISARAKKADLPNVLPRVLRIGETLRDAGEEGSVITKVAVAYAARGEFDRASKLIQGFEEGFDRENVSHEVAIELAEAGQYERALQLAGKAGDYFGPIAFVKIAAEALKRGDKNRASEIASRTLSQLLKDIKEHDHREGSSEAERMAEVAVLYSDLGQKARATELMSVAFKRAKAVGKPGERYSALRAVVAAYSQLGLYTQAIEAAHAFDYGDLNVLAEVGAKAAERGLNAYTVQIIRAIWEMPVKEHQSAKVKALASIAVQLAGHNQKGEALKLLRRVEEFADTSQADENTAEALKNLAVAFAQAGDFKRAFERVQTIKQPYLVTWALLEIGYLWAKTGQKLDGESVKLLDEIVNVKLAPLREPVRLVKEGGWEIPGLAQSRPIRPREIVKTRDRTVERHWTLYEPGVETLLERPFEPTAKQKTPGLKTEGLQVIMIEEHDIEGRKYCYVVRTQEIFRDEATNARKYPTSFEDFLYFDEDGDGKFETLEEGLGVRSRPRIPEWVLKGNRR
jgi:tetratricopeptide (TPR) repeat protein